MLPVTPIEVLAVLRELREPGSERDVVELGLVREIDVRGADVYVRITLPAHRCGVVHALSMEARDVIEGLPGVDRAYVAIE